MANFSPEQIIVSCEHGGRLVPDAYRHLFMAAADVLRSHRGWDAGSAELAEALARALGVEPVIARVTRLLVDLNRSPGHPRQFSEFTRQLPAPDRERLVGEYYVPHRASIEDRVRESVKRSGRALHVSVHTFTPALDGKLRRADVALLYDPRRPAELALCKRWARAMVALAPDLLVRRNYPYKGTSDGLTTYLRKRFPDPRYLGVELEVNQRRATAAAADWCELAGRIAVMTRDVLLGGR